MTLKPTYATWHLYNPVMGATVDIPEPSEEDYTSALHIQAVDGGGVALADPVILHVIICDDADGTPSSESFTATITAEGAGQIMYQEAPAGGFYPNRFLCTTDENGELDITLAHAAGGGIFYVGIVTPDGAYHISDPLVFIGSTDFSGFLNYTPVWKTVVITATIGGETVTGTDAAAVTGSSGAIAGTGVAEGSVGYGDSAYTITFDESPDDETTVYAAYDSVATETLATAADIGELIYGFTLASAPVVEGSVTVKLGTSGPAGPIIYAGDDNGSLVQTSGPTGGLDEGTIGYTTGDVSITYSGTPALVPDQYILTDYQYSWSGVTMGTGSTGQTGYSPASLTGPVVFHSVVVDATCAFTGSTGTSYLVRLSDVGATGTLAVVKTGALLTAVTASASSDTIPLTCTGTTEMVMDGAGTFGGTRAGVTSVKAAGKITFAGQPNEPKATAFDIYEFSWVKERRGSGEIPVDTTAALCTAQFISKFNTDVPSATAVATATGSTGAIITAGSSYGGTLGNALTLATDAGTCIILSGANLSGGAESVQAYGTVTLSGDPVDGDTITIGTETYRWITGVTGLGDVKVGANATGSAANLVTIVTAQSSFIGTTGSTNVGPVATLTAKTPAYGGTLGNSITFRDDSSYTTLHPTTGLLHDGVNAIFATGSLTFTGPVPPPENLTIDTTAFYFKKNGSTVGAGDVAIGSDVYGSVANMRDAILRDMSASVTATGYTGGGGGANNVVITAVTAGTGPNNWTFAESGTEPVTNVTMDGSGKFGGTTAGVNAVAAQGKIYLSDVPDLNDTFLVSTQEFVWKATGSTTGYVILGDTISDCVDNIVTAINRDLPSTATAAAITTGATGTISNYTTGAFTLTYTDVPAIDTPVTASWNTQVTAENCGQISATEQKVWELVAAMPDEEGYPIQPGTITLSYQIGNTGHTASDVDNEDGTGVIAGTGLATVSSVDYASGVINLEFSGKSGPKDGTDLDIVYTFAVSEEEIGSGGAPLGG